MAGPLGSLFGLDKQPWYNTASPIFGAASDALLGAAANPGNPWGGAAYGAQTGQQRRQEQAQIQKAEEQRQAQINQTAQWLRQQGQDQLAGAVETGMISGADAFKMAWDGMNPEAPELTANQRDWQFAQQNPGFADFLKGGAGGVEYGTTPIWGQRPDGTYGYGVQGKDGSFLPVDTGDLTILDPRSLAADRAYGSKYGGAQGENAAQAPVALANLQRLDAQSDNVISTIDKAMGQAGWNTTGLIGQVTGGIAGTPAYDLRQTAQTIKANLGFAELQAMRDASPTGGALGQVAVQELEALQSTLASLDPNQSEAQLRENLQLVKDLLERQKMYRRAAAEARYGSNANQPGQSGNVTSGGVQWSIEP